MALSDQGDGCDAARKRQTLGLLVGGMTHDLNNILAVIDGYTGMLQRQFAGDARVLAKLEAIASAAARAADMARHVAAYREAKPDTGRCDPAAVLDTTRPLMQIILGSRIDLQVHLPDQTLMVPVSTDRMTEMLLHLTVHAKEGLRRGGAIHVKIDGTADHVRIVFGDRGDAPATEQAVVAVDGDEPPYGLPMAAALAQAAGGTLMSAGDVPSSALALALVLPRVAVPDSATGLAGKTVLFVEDEVMLHPILEERLENMGMRVLKAANADGALCLQRDHAGKIDVLLTDIVMPDTDGVRLAELMMDARPEISVVYMTGHGDIIRQMQFAANLPEYALIVAKPFREADLSWAMQKALEDLDDAD